MIRCELYSPRCEWEVTVFVSINEYWVDEILERLWEIGIDGKNAQKAFENISSGKLDTGLCFSNYQNHQSVVVVSQASSASELFNSIMHEFKHLSSHMAKSCGLEETGEEVAYATGELAHDMWPYIKHLMCDCCRKKIYQERTHGEDNGFGVGQEGSLTYYYE